jgi:transglutaminase-like putative cysteine protease
MRKLARAGATEPTVKAAALGILNRAGVAGDAAINKLRALFRFVRDEIVFARDAIGIEVLQSPRYTLHSRSGDCDDKAILLAGLAHAAGLPGDYSFRVIGADRARPGRFSHVYVVVRLAGRAFALDPTYGTNRFGWEYPNASRMGELPA